jgi:transcriptional regulator with XRE-family HTH domain
MPTPHRRPLPTDIVIPQTTLGDRLVIARKSAELKQAHFVAVLGKSRFSVSSWENDHYIPSRSDLIVWAQECHVDFDWLCDDIYPEGFDVHTWTVNTPAPPATPANPRRSTAQRRRQGLRCDDQVIDLRDAERKSAAVTAAWVTA